MGTAVGDALPVGGHEHDVGSAVFVVDGLDGADVDEVEVGIGVVGFHVVHDAESLSMRSVSMSTGSSGSIPVSWAVEVGGRFRRLSRVRSGSVMISQFSAMPRDRSV